MISLHSDGSPFLILWYFFLVFLGAVITINIFMLLIRAFLQWRITSILKKDKKREAAGRNA